jgi:hypothetical protein
MQRASQSGGIVCIHLCFQGIIWLQLEIVWRVYCQNEDVQYLEEWMMLLIGGLDAAVGLIRLLVRASRY